MASNSAAEAKIFEMPPRSCDLAAGELKDSPWRLECAPMCYSAQIQAAYLKYLRETGAEMDIDQFVEIFGARVSDSSIRIPRAVERWFDEPRNDAERKIKALIDEYRNSEIIKLEREVLPGGLDGARNGQHIIDELSASIPWLSPHVT